MNNSNLQNIAVNPAENILFYQALLSGLEDVVISSDEYFVIQTWNAAAEEIFGVNAAEVIGKASVDVYKIDYVQATREEVMQILAKNNFWRGQAKAINKNGTIFFLDINIRSVRNKYGKKIGYVSIGKNITKELEQQKSLENFAAILTLLEESFLIIDKDYKIVFSRLKGRIKKLSADSCEESNHIFNCVPDYLFKDAKKSYEKAFKGNIVKYETQSNNTENLYLMVTCLPLKDESKNVTNVCIIIKDFTDEKEIELLSSSKAEIEKKLLESSRLFEEFMENSPLLAWVVDVDGCIHYINKTYFKALGSPENILGKNLADIYPPENANIYVDNIKKVIETGIALETIETGRIPSFINSSFKIVKFPIRYKNIHMVAGWGVDITDQLTIQESLSQLNQHKDKLVSIIAHDLRGPLGINATYLHTIIEDFESYSSDELLSSLNLILKGATKCYELVDEMLLWAKGQLAQIIFEPKPVDIKTEILRITGNLWDQLLEKNITLKREFKYNGEIFIDVDMFGVIVRNFITNAIKFSHPGSSIIIETNLYNKKEVLISVKDSGLGIKKEMVEKILNKINFESTFGTKGEKGTGLGLLISKEYIEKNGGRMGIYSIENKGSDFNFTVPVYNK